MDKEIEKHVERLKKKFDLLDQDISSWLEGLLVANPAPYWEYIHLDALLSLQTPRTDFPDERIFIIYHQITELYFRLVLHEMEQIAHNGRNVLPSGEDKGWHERLSADFFIERLGRINRYFDMLIQSFGIMVQGMEPAQFLRFRMALLPASGFQSVQYRKIELCATTLIRLVDKDHRQAFRTQTKPSVEEMFEHIYWKKGAINTSTGGKTLTLRQFEDKYQRELMAFANRYKSKNLWIQYLNLPEAERENNMLRESLRQFDRKVNIEWPLVHYKSAVRYLQDEEDALSATGGTNWREYLPPKNRLRIFYPELWSEEEKEQWGRITG